MPTPAEQANLELVRRYFAALGDAPGDELAFYAPDIVQEEYPNRFLPGGARRDLAAIREAAERGRAVMASQEFELVNAIASGNVVAIEARWAGTLAIDAGAVPAGTVMRAHFGVFFEFRDGRVVAQRNYDCFDPW
jgi:ketosteroid isomerase-like protein